jgi:hypothetical protein
LIGVAEGRIEPVPEVLQPLARLGSAANFWSAFLLELVEAERRAQPGG